MFDKKYTLTLLNSKWEVLKKNLPITFIPKKDEFIWIDEQYYEVVTIIHSINTVQSVYIVVNELSSKPFIKSIKVEKDTWFENFFLKNLTTIKTFSTFAYILTQCSLNKKKISIKDGFCKRTKKLQMGKKVCGPFPTLIAL